MVTMFSVTSIKRSPAPNTSSLGEKPRNQNVEKMLSEAPLRSMEKGIAHLTNQILQEQVSLSIEGFLKALLLGLGSMVASCEIDNMNKVQVTLRSSVLGTLATRSRVPIEWHLEKTFQVWVEEGSKLRLKGVQVVPIDGGLEAWKILSAQFAKAGAKTLSDKKAIAWQWWDGDGGRELLKGTKFWRVVESLEGLGYGKAVPTYIKASMVLGCALGIHQDLTTLHYRLLPQEQGVYVVGTLQHLKRDELAPAKDEAKEKLGRDLFGELNGCSSKRKMAIKFGPSSYNYGALFCSNQEERAASPAPVEKLFTVARNYGGATKRDCLKGRASSWQFDDETYQMTGDDGRVVWRPVDE